MLCEGVGSFWQSSFRPNQIDRVLIFTLRYCSLFHYHKLGYIICNIRLGFIKKE